MNWQFSVTFAFPLLVCECVCRYTRVSMYGQACVHVSVYMHMYLCASGHVCVCVYVHVCAYVCFCVSASVCIYGRVCLRNLYAGQEAIVRTEHGITDWFQIGKGVCQGYILSSCLFNLYAEYIMRNVGVDEAQTGSKTAKRNVNNLRYANDTTLMQKVKRN